MKTVKLSIEDSVYKEIKNALGIKVALGSAYGVIDEFVSLVIQGIEEGIANIVIGQK